MKRFAVFMFCIVPIALAWCVIVPIAFVTSIVMFGAVAGWQMGKDFIYWARDNG